MEKNIKGITQMNKDITEFPNLKQIEQILWSKNCRKSFQRL